MIELQRELQGTVLIEKIGMHRVRPTFRLHSIWPAFSRLPARHVSQLSRPPPQYNIMRLCKKKANKLRAAIFYSCQLITESQTCSTSSTHRSEVMEWGRGLDGSVLRLERGRGGRGQRVEPQG